MVPKAGFEPARALAHYALNVARLPVPPLRREMIFYPKVVNCQTIEWVRKVIALNRLQGNYVCDWDIEKSDSARYYVNGELK